MIAIFERIFSNTLCFRCSRWLDINNQHVKMSLNYATRPYQYAKDLFFLKNNPCLVKAKLSLYVKIARSAPEGLDIYIQTKSWLCNQQGWLKEK